MRKKILVVLCSLLLGVGSINANLINVCAQEMTQEEKDYSYLPTGNKFIELSEIQPKGVYLMYGTSSIKDAGTGKIAAGGITSAAKKCKVTINVIVERLSGSTWARVTSWTVTRDSALSVGSDRTLSVGRGYYYRVRCLHFAHTDASSSWTGNLWV